MPKPVGDSGAYIPGLDGIRALAVLAVLGYHLGLPYFSGGLLGVGVFFTLSGFLITRILLTSWSRTGTLELRRFWLHRARRLLPALGLVLAVVLVGTAFTDPDALAERWGETWSAAAYVANWHTIAAGESYFERFVGPGPLDHLWSLSVEEQFYLVWPVLLLVALRGFGMRRRQLVYLTAGLTAGSFLLLGVLASPGFDHTRAYEGTDTRAGGILVGALLALVWDRVVAAGNLPDVRAAAQAAGVLGLAGIAWLVVSTDDYSMQLYSYGLLLLSVCSAGLIAAVAMPGSVLGRVLGIAPMRWLGERSYGIYLWQLPIIAFLPAARLESSRLAWSVLLTVTTLLLAELSWRLVEDPVRRHGLVGAVRRVRHQRLHTRTGRRTVRVPLLPAGALCVALVGTVSLVSCHQVGGDQDVAALTAGVPDEGLPPLPPPETAPPAPQRRPAEPVRQARTAADVVHRRRPRRRVHLGRADRPPLPAGSRGPAPRPAASGRREAGRHRHLRRPLDRRDLAQAAQRAGGGAHPDGGRVRRLLVDRDGHQRLGQPGGGWGPPLPGADRPDDAAAARPAGAVVDGQDARAFGAVRRRTHARLQRGAPRRLRPVPEAARLRLARRGPRPVVHQRRDPLHDARLPRAGAPDRARPGPGVPEGRSTGTRLRRPVRAGLSSGSGTMG